MNEELRVRAEIALAHAMLLNEPKYVQRRSEYIRQALVYMQTGVKLVVCMGDGGRCGFVMSEEMQKRNIVDGCPRCGHKA